MTNVATEHDILEILGAVEPPVVAAIRALAATRDELEEATAINDEPFENLGDERIDELRALLANRPLAKGTAPLPKLVEPGADNENWRPQD